jgi:hypothetical protein
VRLSGVWRPRQLRVRVHRVFLGGSLRRLANSESPSPSPKKNDIQRIGRTERAASADALGCVSACFAAGLNLASEGGKKMITNIPKLIHSDSLLVTAHFHQPEVTVEAERYEL